MIKKELIDKLLKYKSHLKHTYCDLDAIISDVMSDISDYNGDHFDELDSYIYQYESSDGVEEFIKETVREYGILALKNRLSEVNGDYNWYWIDSVDGTIYPRDTSDVEEWIDDILDALDYNSDKNDITN